MPSKANMLADSPNQMENSSLTKLSQQANWISKDVSRKFIPCVNRKEILTDLFPEIENLREAIRWRYYHRTRRQEEKLERTVDEGKEILSDTDSESEVEIENDSIILRGIGSNVRSKSDQEAPKGSDAVEEYIRDVERTLLTMASNNLKEDDETEISKKI